MRAHLPLILAALAAPSPAAPAQDGPAPALASTVDYRRAVLSARGEPGRGRVLFEDANRTRCLLCHALGGRGGALGPGLDGVGGRHDRAGLLDAVLEPSATIHPDYRASVIATKAGVVIQGIVRPAADGDAVEVATSATESVRVARADIEERAESKVSFMPEGLHRALTPAEMADLLAYLGESRIEGSGSPGEAVDAGEIPRASKPVAFRPVVDAASAFHRPVWYGPVPGRPRTQAVVEMQRGRIWLVDADDPGRRELFVDLGADTTPGELTGLTSLAFHPDFARNRRYFLKLHTPRGAGRLAVRVVERSAAGDGPRDSGGASKLLLTIPVVSEIHNGGHLAFGPDGYLYVGMGDTGPQGDPRGHGQDLGTHLGKILRIDVDRSEGDRPYAIPPDNPFLGRPGALPEVWALGFREPWRFSFDPPTGDLWVGDVGQNQWEEVGIVRAGENHGWNVIEGRRPHSGRFASGEARYVPPVFAYAHRVGPSVTGGFVYRGARHPALVGKYVFGDYETRRVWALEQRDRRVASIIEIGRAPEKIASFGVDDEGELYTVSVERGTIHRIDPSGLDLAPAPPAREVVETSRRAGIAWKTTLATPPPAWAATDFDDSGWASSPGGFGTRGTPGAVVRTEWRGREIWLRREFTLPAGFDPASLALLAHHDEDAEVFLNGVLAARLPGFTSDYEEAPIAEAALAALRPGRNVLAVRCRQTGGGQYIDVGIVEVPGRRP